MECNEEGFRLTYSAKEQEEIVRIRKKYLSQETDKMALLRRLDGIPHQKAQIRALTLGILGALLLGTGMSLVMTELAAILGMTEEMAMLAGISVGVVGLVMVALAYPLYNRVLTRERHRLAPQILQLTDELMQ